MLKSYEAVYENGQVKWLDGKPAISSARVIVTVLEEMKETTSLNEQTVTKRRTFPSTMAGQANTLGDIVSPIVDEEDWECLK